MGAPPETKTGQNDLTKVKSYFYLFIGREKTEENNYTQEERKSMNSSMDSILSSVFKRLEASSDGEVKVISNPSRYNPLRKVFGITRLPAFGLSLIDISEVEVGPHPKDLPSWWRFDKKAERKDILGSGRYFPSAQRNILQFFSGSKDEMFNFVRDIHTANVDGGISSVMDVVTEILKDKDIKNVGELVGKAKKLFLW